jgi:hypothetical protein
LDGGGRSAGSRTLPLRRTGQLGSGDGPASASASAPSTTTARSGDYSGAQTDPGLSTFWLAGEQAVIISAACQWRTRIAQLVP